MPAVMIMKRFPQVPVPFLVTWYPYANTKEQGRAAVVTHSGQNGEVFLTVFDKGGSIRNLRNVKHVWDPIHARRKETTMKQGGWDYTPGFGHNLYRPDIEDLADFMRLSIGDMGSAEANYDAERVLEMHGQGYTPEQIASRTKVDIKTVNTVIKMVTVPDVAEKNGATVSKAEFDKVEKERKRLERELKKATKTASDRKPSGPPPSPPVETEEPADENAPVV